MRFMLQRVFDRAWKPMQCGGIAPSDWERRRAAEAELNARLRQLFAEQRYNDYRQTNI